MDNKDYDSEQGLIFRQAYAAKNGLTTFDLDEWDNICEVLRRDVSFNVVYLFNEYVDKYNEAYGTDYDWDWMSYEPTEENRVLLEDMLEFAHAAEEDEHNEDT